MKNLLYSHYCTKLPCLFPSLEDVCKIDIDLLENPDKPDNGAYSMFKNFQAVIFRNSLTIFELNNLNIVGKSCQEEILCEIEFDSNLTHVAWDTTGQCLAVVDKEGNVHLTKVDGTVFFSRKVFTTLSQDTRVISIEFLPDQNDLQSLFGLLSNGVTLLMKGLDILGLCDLPTDQLALVPQILKQSKFGNISLRTIAPITKACFFHNKSSNSIQIITINRELKIHIYDIFESLSFSDILEPIQPPFFQNVLITDFHILNPKDNSLIGIFCNSNGNIFIYDIISQFSLASCHIGSQCSISTVKDYSIGLEYNYYSFNIILQSKSTPSNIYFLTCLLSGNDQAFSEGTIIPQGLEHTSHTSYFKFMPSVGNISSLIVRQDKTLQVKVFSEVSHTLTEEMLIFARRGDPTVLQSISPFGKLIGTFYHFTLVNPNESLLLSSKDLYFKRRFSTEIIQILSFLFDYLNLQDDAFDNLIHTALDVINNGNNFVEIGLCSSLNIIQRWNHKNNITISFLKKFFEDDFPVFSHSPVKSKQNALRFLLADQFQISLRLMIEKGAIEKILFLLERNIKLPPSFNCMEAMNRLPKDVNVQNLLTITKYFMDNTLKHSITAASTQQCPVLHHQVCPNPFYAFIQELFQRALYYTENENPMNTLQFVETILQIINSSNAIYAQMISPGASNTMVPISPLVNISPDFPPSNTIQSLREDLKTVQHYLTIQILSEEVLDIDVDYDEVKTVGCLGMILERLDNVTEESLKSFIETNLLEYCQRLDVKLDEYLMKWIDDTMENCLISIPESQDNLGENTNVSTGSNQTTNTTTPTNSTCTITRLIIVVSCIQEHNFCARSILKLFHIPSIENMCFQTSPNNEISTNLEKGNTLSIGETLCELATSLYDKVESNIKDQLIEAVRLFHIKLLALKYNIDHLDVRDAQHLGFTVNIISGSSNKPNKILDLLSFSIDKESKVMRIDIKSSCVRALIHIIQEYDIKKDSKEDISGSSTLEEELSIFLGKIPVEYLQQIVEDSIQFCIDQIEEFSIELIELETSLETFLQSKSNRKSSQESSDEEKELSEEIQYIKELLQKYTSGGIKLSQYFLDYSILNPISSTLKETDAKSRSKFQSSSLTNSTSLGFSICNTILLQDFKRLFQLQQLHEIYLPLSSLRKENICRKFMENKTVKVVKDWSKSLSESSSTSSIHFSNKQEETEHESQVFNKFTSNLTCVSEKLRKITLLLHLNTQLYVNILIKQLIQNNHKKYALEFMKVNMQDMLLSSSSKSHSSTLEDEFCSTNSANSVNYAHISSQSKENWNIMVDNAAILCSAALKNDQRNKSYGYYSPSYGDSNNPVDFELNAFNLSNTLISNAIVDCQESVLCRALDALTMTDMMLSVYDRVEKATSNSTHTLTPNEGIFSKDGLLMQEETILPLLAKYCLKELKFRDKHSNSNASLNLASKKNLQTRELDQEIDDLEQVINTLQRHENHLLASQILFRSWMLGAIKNQLLRASILSLCRKILTYRDMDTQFAIACLSALPLDSVVKELKATVPSIQSDFSRLQTVAMIGEEISHLWDDESLLLLFQNLQTNAKWWHNLSSIGLQIDLKLFQSSDLQLREKYIESIIPEMLIRNNFDLEMAMEYCRSFDVEPEVASLSYIVLLLRELPQNNDQHQWMSKIKSAVVGINEKILILTLQKVLKYIHSLTYEKILFVCTWLLELIPDSEFDNDQEDNSINLDTDEDSEKLDQATMSKDEYRANKIILTTSNLAKMSLKLSNTPAINIKYYKRNDFEVFINIAKYLLSLSVPANIMLVIRETPLFGSLYKYMAGSYQMRLPFWQLINDPWSVLEPILNVSSNFADKLLPLCFILGLDKEEFHARSIFATYRHLSLSSLKFSSTNHDISDRDLVEEVYHGEIMAHNPLTPRQVSTLPDLVQDIDQLILQSLYHPLYKIKVWQWIYEREKEKNKSLAVIGLERALGILANFHFTEANAEYIHLKTELEGNLKKLRLEAALAKIMNIFKTSQLYEMLTTWITMPKDLLKAILEIIVEYAWEIQMASLQVQNIPPINIEIMNHPPVHSVIIFLEELTPLLVDISIHCSSSTTLSGGEENGKALLESTINFMINRILTDYNSNSRSKVEGTSVESLPSIDNSSSKKVWKFASSETHTLPSEAEGRRREDLFMSFGITTLLLLLSHEPRLNLINHLNGIMRTSGQRAMRRITGRSRYRAAQALFFLPIHIKHKLLDPNFVLATPLNSASSTPHSRSTTPSHGVGDSLLRDVRRYVVFLYCLAEMQEIRLSSSEDSLLDALGLRILDNGTTCQLSEIPSNHGSSARSLIMTWIHDEGHLLDAVELARDLFCLGHLHDHNLLIKLIKHMVDHHQYRTLLQTLSNLKKMDRIEDLLYDQLSTDIIYSLSLILDESAEKINQASKSIISRPVKTVEWIPVIFEPLNSNTLSSDEGGVNLSSPVAAQNIKISNYHPKNILLASREILFTVSPLPMSFKSTSDHVIHTLDLDFNLEDVLQTLFVSTQFLSHFISVQTISSTSSKSIQLLQLIHKSIGKLFNLSVAIEKMLPRDRPYSHIIIQFLRKIYSFLESPFSMLISGKVIDKDSMMNENIWLESFNEYLLPKSNFSEGHFPHKSSHFFVYLFFTYQDDSVSTNLIKSLYSLHGNNNPTNSKNFIKMVINLIVDVYSHVPWSNLEGTLPGCHRRVKNDMLQAKASLKFSSYKSKLFNWLRQLYGTEQETLLNEVLQELPTSQTQILKTLMKSQPI